MAEQDVEQLRSKCLDLFDSKRFDELEQLVADTGDHRSELEEYIEGLRLGEFLRLPSRQDAQADTVVSGGDTHQTASGDSVVDDLSRLFGKYRLLKRLGRGGMGDVYLAEDLQTGPRHVAIKIPRLDIARDPHAVDRFRQEGRALASLNHPYVCGILEVGEDAGAPFIAMEFVRGKTLRENLDVVERMEEQHVVILLSQLCRGMHAAHTANLGPLSDPTLDLNLDRPGWCDGQTVVSSRGVVHRDLKPENIILTSEDRTPKIVDFGLAFDISRSGERLTRDACVGTLGYMAPEQFLGEPPSHATDIYALGIVTFEALTRRLPSVEENTQSLSTLRSEVSDELAGIVAKMTATAPSDRYQSMLDVLEDLEPLVKQVSAEEWASVHHAISRPPVQARWPKLAVVALFAVMLAAVLITFRTRTVEVRVEVDESVLAREEWSVFIDDRRLKLDADGIEAIELSLGEHEWTIRQGKTQISNPERFIVGKESNPVLRIDITKVVPPSDQSIPIEDLVELTHKCGHQWTLRDPDDAVISAFASMDDAGIAVCEYGGRIGILDTSSGKVERVIGERRSTPLIGLFIPSPDRVAAVEANILELIAIDDGQTLASETLAAAGEVVSVRMSSNRERIVVAKESGVVVVHDAETLQRLRHFDLQARISAAAFGFNSSDTLLIGMHDAQRDGGTSGKLVLLSLNKESAEPEMIERFHAPIAALVDLPDDIYAVGTTSGEKLLMSTESKVRRGFQAITGPLGSAFTGFAYDATKNRLFATTPGVRTFFGPLAEELDTKIMCSTSVPSESDEDDLPPPCQSAAHKRIAVPKLLHPLAGNRLIVRDGDGTLRAWQLPASDSAMHLMTFHSFDSTIIQSNSNDSSRGSCGGRYFIRSRSQNGSSEAWRIPRLAQDGAFLIRGRVAEGTKSRSTWSVTCKSERYDIKHGYGLKINVGQDRVWIAEAGEFEPGQQFHFPRLSQPTPEGFDVTEWNTVMVRVYEKAIYVALNGDVLFGGPIMADRNFTPTGLLLGRQSEEGGWSMAEFDDKAMWVDRPTTEDSATAASIPMSANVEFDASESPQTDRPSNPGHSTHP